MWRFFVFFSFLRLLNLNILLILVANALMVFTLENVKRNTRFSVMNLFRSKNYLIISRWFDATFGRTINRKNNEFWFIRVCQTYIKTNQDSEFGGFFFSVSSQSRRWTQRTKWLLSSFQSIRFLDKTENIVRIRSILIISKSLISESICARNQHHWHHKLHEYRKKKTFSTRRYFSFLLLLVASSPFYLFLCVLLFFFSNL